MNFKIHRGTQEIGGSCVEVWTENTRILLDFGMPLVEKDGKEFDYSKHSNSTSDELKSHGILPNIKGLYNNETKSIDGVVISHAHQDHFGLASYINTDIPFYLGKATSKIIELNNLFTPKELHLDRTVYYEKEKTFKIGDISITAYWADHSAFDAYSLLVEAEGKCIFYSGDFRGHGRKSKVFKWFTHNAPTNVDYLLLEGTTIGRDVKPHKSEIAIENDLYNLFAQKGRFNCIYTSGQNIDRLVSIFNACKRANRTMVVDVYIATILKELSPFAKIPYPSSNFHNLRVMFPYFTSRRLSKEGNEKILYQFRKFKITKEEISNNSGNIVMLVRPSMQKDLERIKNIDGGVFIYSMWKGYLKKPAVMKFIDYLLTRKFSIHYHHTSGHADTDTLKELVDAINPQNIVPIHTFNPKEYKKIFTNPVTILKDGEVRHIK